MGGGREKRRVGERREGGRGRAKETLTPILGASEGGRREGGSEGEDLGKP